MSAPEPRLDADFLGPLVGERFELVSIVADTGSGSASASAAATLAVCEPSERGFRLEFRADEALEQATYGIRGHGLDDVVFLVPVARTPAGTTLEAIFTHIEGDLS